MRRSTRPAASNESISRSGDIIAAPPSSFGCRVSLHVPAAERVGAQSRARYDATNAFLAETNLALDERDTWFGRFELTAKSGHDLAIDSHDIFTVAKLQGGYTRYFDAWNGLKPGIGAGLSAGIVPDSLKPFYGNRVNIGLAVFVTLRPAERGM